MKKSKSKSITWLDRILINNPYCVGLCLSEEAFNREMVRLKVPVTERPEWITEGKDGITYEITGDKNHQCFCIVCIRLEKKITATQIIGLLTHEAVHVWQIISNDLNERFPSREFEALSIQRITQDLVYAYCEMKGKKWK